MNKRFLIYIAVTAIISVLATFFVLRREMLQTQNEKIGNFLFEKTNLEGEKVQKIIIKSGQIQATLFYENKFWKIKEADNYYADLVTVNQLFQNINSAKIEAEITDKNEEETGLIIGKDNPSGYEIQTYNAAGEMLDDVIIGKKINNFFYAKNANSPEIYMASGDFLFSDKLYYWLQQPLITLKPENIESLIMQNPTGQQIAFRKGNGAFFYNIKQQRTNILPLLEKFMMLTFIGVKNSQNTPMKDEQAQKTIVLFTNPGLIYGIDLYKVEDQYWIKVSLSISKLPTKMAQDYIKDTQFLYQNWYFKLDRQTGSFLMNYQID